MPEIEEVFENTTENAKRLVKNKYFWIVGGGAVALALLLSKSKNKQDDQALVVSSYPEPTEPPGQPTMPDMGNQLDAYATILDSQLQQGLEAIYAEMTGYMSDLAAEQMRQQEAMASQFAYMQSALEQAAYRNQQDYSGVIMQMQQQYETELARLAQELQSRAYSTTQSLMTDTWYSGAIFGGQSLRPQAANYGDYVVRQDSQVMFTQDDRVIEKDIYGGVVTYYPNGNITFDYSNAYVPPAPQSLLDSVKKQASSSAGSTSNKMTIGGHTYSVDSKGNIYKDNRYIPAENFKYIPQEVLNKAREVKRGV